MVFEVLPGDIVEIAAFLSMASIFALLTLGLNLQWGHTGLFNAGIAAFFALGAYAAAILMTPPSPPLPGVYPGHLGGYSMPFLVAVGGSALLAAIAGLLIAIPTLRLRADYLAIATLGLSEVLRLYLNNDEPRTGGTYGIYQIPKLFPEYGFTPHQVEVLTAVVAVILLVVVLALLQYVGSSPWARVLKAVREDEDAAEVLGKDTFKVKLQAFVIGCAIMGVAGSLFTVFLAFVEPVTSFRPLTTFTVWAMLILGGSGNHRGAVFGAFLFWSFEWITVRVSLFAGGTARPSFDQIDLMMAVVTIETIILLWFLLWPRWRKRSIGRFLGVSAAILAAENLLLASLLFVRLPPWLLERLALIRLMVVGLLIVLIVMYRPQGVIPERLQTIWRERPV